MPAMIFELNRLETIPAYKPVVLLKFKTAANITVATALFRKFAVIVRANR